MSNFEGLISVAFDSHVALVELQHPPHNFVNATVLGHLADCFEELDSNPEVRCLVLAAQGKVFCAGADFSNDEGSGNTARRFYASAARIFATRKPIVAAVQGAAIGAGLGLALVADFRIAAPEARFAANFVKLGIHPGFGLTHTLPRLIGQQCASLLLYTGRRIGGAEAVRIGLADSLAEGGQLRQTAIALAHEIAENAPLAVMATRSTIRKGLVEAVIAQTAHEASEQERLFLTDDYAEGLRAVSERRPGNFNGR
ncbi:enoyl-CoA hydratase/isomerase family protein [Novosphingobium aquae]|uniref:Enoyl-CoA hydratase/isomerase family protein n=1 Tax=Novosphingobium aquae TaxID=3133435 RepID=A0ABU8S910_9SPHN